MAQEKKDSTAFSKDGSFHFGVRIKGRWDWKATGVQLGIFIVLAFFPKSFIHF